MQSKATTVQAYLAALPEDRRAAISAVREVILKNMDSDLREGMQYGMIGYFIPHEVFPHGYHCDPRQPLPFAGLASQSGHMSLYLMCTYMNGPISEWFQKAWKDTGRKLDMGKACVRFKKLDDVALDVVAEAFRRVTARKYIEVYTANLASTGRGPDGKPLAKSGTAKKPASKKTVSKKATPRKPAKKKIARR